MGKNSSKWEISLKSMKMQLNLVPLLPSFPFSGHANGAKWNKMGKNSSKWVKISSKWVKISLEKVSWFSAVCLQIQLFFTEIYVIVAKGGQKWVQNFEFSKNGQKFLEKWWNFRKNLEKTRKIRVKTGNFRKNVEISGKNMEKPENSG